MVKAVVFADLCKAACDILDDDYTTKYLLKAKTAKIAMPKVGGVKFTIENEVKCKGVDGKLTAGFAYKGVSIDKLTLKGDKYAVEASKVCNGVKMKLKGDPFCPASAAVSAEKKCATMALTAAADKKKLGASGVGAFGKDGLFGADVCFVPASGAFNWSVGASYILSGVFAAVTFSSKQVANFAFSYSLSSKTTLATSFNTDSALAVGFKHAPCSGVTIAGKTTECAASSVMTYKFSKDASVVASSTLKYDELASPAFGVQLNIG